jgi:hypothetical protein
VTKRDVLRGLARAGLTIVIVAALATTIYLLRQIPLVQQADVVYGTPRHRRVFNLFVFAAMLLITIGGGYVWYRLFPDDFATTGHQARVQPPADSGRQWTPEDDERLLELHRDGQSDEWIGIDMDRTTDAVRDRLKTLSTPSALPSPVDPGTPETTD